MLGTLRLAWRNTWRNARRSALTVLSIGCGLAAVMMNQSLMKTVQRQMIQKSTGVMTGHLQAQARGVTDRKIPDKLLDRPAVLEAALLADPRVEGAAARLAFTGLVYSAAGSRGILVACVEPERELKVSIIPTYITSGAYFGVGVRDMVLGDKLASELDLRVGEKTVVMAQAKNGEMNSELFRVAGIYHSGSESFDGQIVYIPLAAGQRIRGEAGRVSYLLAKLKDIGDTWAVKADLAAARPDPGVVLLTYEDVGLEVVGIQKFEDAVMAVVLVVIFSIVGLGILNTVSMSMYERIREFGVLRAVGARRSVIAGMLLAEALILGVCGVLSGLALGGGIIGYWGTTGLNLPIGKALSYWLPFESVVYLRHMWRMHLWSAAGLVFVSVVAALGPATRAVRIAVADALRSV